MDDPMQQARELLAAESEEYAKWGVLNLPIEELRYDLQAALRAINAALRAAPDGYVLVPVEPTEEMIEASLIRIPIAKRINPGQHLRIYGARAWDAMLAARPQGVKDA